jgi:maleate isomerase
MQPAKFLGTIVPSSNRIVERVTNAVLADFPETSAHFGRVSVTGDKVHLSTTHDWGRMLDTAQMLADARLDAIVWNGSKGAGLGFGADRELCRRIEDKAGVPATTSVLAIEEIFRTCGVERFALVTPFPSDYQARVIETLGREGFHCTAERHLDIADNHAIGLVTEEETARLVRVVAQSRPDAVLILCTNLFGAPVVAPLERELGLPVFDSVSAGVWHLLKLAGVDPCRAPHWGSLFAPSAAAPPYPVTSTVSAGSTAETLRGAGRA